MTAICEIPGVLWEDIVSPGASWTHVVKRGTALRITALGDGANVPAIFFNSDCPLERYNMPDTLKTQQVAHLTKGCAIYSDMGRVLFSIVEDTCGWHDPIGGHSTAAMVHTRFGERAYQHARNDFHRNTRDNFLTELAKWGLGLRDLSANVNFFSKVRVERDGAMTFVPGHSKAGDFVELRAEMNVLTVLDTGQHPLDPSPAYAPVPVHIAIRKADPPGSDDLCRISHPENSRGYINTERYFL